MFDSSTVLMALAIAWVFSVALSVWLIRSVTKIVMDKASAESLPGVLDSLAPLLSSLARILLRRPPHLGTQTQRSPRLGQTGGVVEPCGDRPMGDAE